MSRTVKNITELMDMWEQDSKIDISKLKDIAADMNYLTQKYQNIFHNHRTFLKKLRMDYAKVKLWWFKYYKGDPDPDFKQEYREKGLPDFNLRGGRDINLYLDATDELNAIQMKIILNEEIVDYCFNVVEQLKNRGFQLNTIQKHLDWEHGK